MRCRRVSNWRGKLSISIDRENLTLMDAGNRVDGGLTQMFHHGIFLKPPSGGYHVLASFIKIMSSSSE